MPTVDVDSFDYYYDHPPQLPTYDTPFCVHAGWWNVTVHMQDDWKPADAETRDHGSDASQRGVS